MGQGGGPVAARHHCQRGYPDGLHAALQWPAAVRQVLSLKEAGGIQIEVELAQPDACCVTTTGVTSDGDFYSSGTAVGAVATVVYTTSFEIQDPRIVCDVIQLDPHLTGQYARLMLEGKALTIRTNQLVTHSQAIGRKPTDYHDARLLAPLQYLLEFRA